MNLDGSGGLPLGQRAKFLQNGHDLGHNKHGIVTLSKDSTQVSVEDLGKLGFQAFRIFSVDGGHTYNTTFSDMSLAACVLRPGGVFIVVRKMVPLSELRKNYSFLQACKSFEFSLSGQKILYFSFAG